MVHTATSMGIASTSPRKIDFDDDDQVLNALSKGISDAIRSHKEKG